MTRPSVIALILLPVLVPAAGSSAPSGLDEGNALFVLDRFEEALRVYSGVAAASGEEAPLAAFLAGKCCTRLGRHDEAARLYGRVIRDCTDTVWAARAGNALGDAYVALGEWGKAIAAYGEVAGRFQDSADGVEARLKMANAYGSPFNGDGNDYNAAIENYLHVLRRQGQKIDPGVDLAQVYFGLGEAYRRLSRWGEAIPYFEQSRSLDPEGVWGAAAQNMIGNCRLAMNQPAAAAEAYRNTADQFPQQRPFVQAANTQLGIIKRQEIRAQADRAPVRTRNQRWIRVLTGNVRITADDWRIECHEAEWDPRTRVLSCSGSVRFLRDGEELFTADGIRFQVPRDQPLILPTPPPPQNLFQNAGAAQQAQFPASLTD